MPEKSTRMNVPPFSLTNTIVAPLEKDVYQRQLQSQNSDQAILFRIFFVGATFFES